MGLGESHDGGFAERLRVPGDWVVPLPAGLTLRESMVLGTAGFTAALALVRMELNGQRPELGPDRRHGRDRRRRLDRRLDPGGARLRGAAVSGRPEHAGYLRGLGAAVVQTPEELRSARGRSRPRASAA